MPVVRLDSPKNPKLLKQGKISQLYKIAGQPKFKDPVTGEIFHKDEFEQIDYKWKSDEKAWKAKYGEYIRQPIRNTRKSNSGDKAKKRKSKG